MSGLKHLMQFPSEFTIKVIGIWSDDFQDQVAERMQRHLNGAEILHLANRTSNAGKFLSVSVTFIAETPQQLDGIYRDLSSWDRVRLLL